MRYTSNKDINKLIKRLIRNNWEFKHRSKHGRIISPDGALRITVSKSPSDHRSLQNFQREVRKFKSTLRNP